MNIVKLNGLKIIFETHVHTFDTLSNFVSQVESRLIFHY